MGEHRPLHHDNAEIRRLKLALVRARQASERDGARAAALMSRDNHRLRDQLAELSERCQSAMKTLGFALTAAARDDLSAEEWRDFGQRAFDQLGEPDATN